MRVAQKGYEDQRQLHWNAYRHFRREVKREIRFAEKEHVRSEILKSKCKTNSNWRILLRNVSIENFPNRIGFTTRF